MVACAGSIRTALNTRQTNANLAYPQDLRYKAGSHNGLPMLTRIKLPLKAAQILFAVLLLTAATAQAAGKRIERFEE
ncbi:MAG: hypothetical protein IH623_24080 [Verrucomicrobia bacterium]|nr:hypothetical protein [Verrucomicrobiota bacterium]